MENILTGRLFVLLDPDAQGLGETLLALCVYLLSVLVHDAGGVEPGQRLVGGGHDGAHAPVRAGRVVVGVVADHHAVGERDLDGPGLGAKLGSHLHSHLGGNGGQA